MFIVLLFRNVACNRGQEEKANLIDGDSLNVHIDYKKVRGWLHIFGFIYLVGFSNNVQCCLDYVDTRYMAQTRCSIIPFYICMNISEGADAKCSCGCISVRN